MQHLYKKLSNIRFHKIFLVVQNISISNYFLQFYFFKLIN